MQYVFISHTISPTALLHHPVAPHFEIFRYFWCTLRNVTVSAPYTALSQIQHFISTFLKLKSNLLVQKRKKPSSCSILLLPRQSYISFLVLTIY